MRLTVGEPAPDFTLPDADGGGHTLMELRGSRVVLFFYPAASTPGCTKEACDFRDNLSLLTGAGYAVLGISPDQPGALQKFRDEQSLPFPLLSDPDHRVLEAYGAWGEKTMYGKKVTGVIRSTFVLDEHAVITEARYNVRATGHVAKLLRDLGLVAP